jgi:hypothetical protein
MKKFILSVVVLGFAVAVQAGNGKECASSKTCTKTEVTKVSKSNCSSATACSSVTKTSTCKGKQVVMSPKGAEQSVRFLVASR